MERREAQETNLMRTLFYDIAVERESNPPSRVSIRGDPEHNRESSKAGK